MLRSRLIDLLKPSDVVIANDAATLPASLRGTHAPSGREIEVRLAARTSLSPSTIGRVIAVVFGEGDFRVPTEDRPQPPALNRGDRLLLGPLRAAVVSRVNHRRLVLLQFDGTADEIWRGLARHGHPVQYAHLQEPLAIWDTWTPIAGLPVAFEPPSASFALSWGVLEALAARGIGFATVTHAAGLSSTGDAVLDAMLPFDEPYVIPRCTARLVNRARARGSRIVAVGTSVVRALEHAGAEGMFAPVRDWRPDDWDLAARSASWTRFSPVRTNPARVITSFFARSQRVRRWPSSTRSSPGAATAPTNSATRCFSKGSEVPFHAYGQVVRRHQDGVTSASSTRRAPQRLADLARVC